MAEEHVSGPVQLSPRRVPLSRRYPPGSARGLPRVWHRAPRTGGGLPRRPQHLARAGCSANAIRQAPLSFELAA